MSGFFRIFLWRKPSRNAAANLPVSAHPPPSKNEIQCNVLGLDNETMCINVPKKSYGKDLLELVSLRLDLMETDYFGLQFTDPGDRTVWLDAAKRIKKQFSTKPPYNLSLRVKFYPSDPSCLREEVTRYLLVLQLKQDLVTGKLQCPYETAVELAALSLQAELGDYDPQEHTSAMVSEFSFLPEAQQTEQFELSVLDRFMRLRGMTAAAADNSFLQRAKLLEQYGVDSHLVQGKDTKWYVLGLTPTGVLVHDSATGTMIGLFVWSRISKVEFSKARLTIVVAQDAADRADQLTFVFSLPSGAACKQVWKSVVEHHTFFRLTVPTHGTTTGTRQLLRTRSRFRFSGRTEFQTTLQPARRSVHFERKPTQRTTLRTSSERIDSEKRSKERERETKKLSTLMRLEQSNESSSGNDPSRTNRSRIPVPAISNSKSSVGLQYAPTASINGLDVNGLNNYQPTDGDANNGTIPRSISYPAAHSFDRVCSKEVDLVPNMNKEPPLSQPPSRIPQKQVQTRRVVPPSSIPKAPVPTQTSSMTRQSGIPTPTKTPSTPMAAGYQVTVAVGMTRPRAFVDEAADSGQSQSTAPAFGSTNLPAASEYANLKDLGPPQASLNHSQADVNVPFSTPAKAKPGDGPPPLPPKALHSRIVQPSILPLDSNLHSPSESKSGFAVVYGGKSGIPVPLAATPLHGGQRLEHNATNTGVKNMVVQRMVPIVQPISGASMQPQVQSTSSAVFGKKPSAKIIMTSV